METMVVLSVMMSMLALSLSIVLILIADNKVRTEVQHLNDLSDASRELRTLTGYPTGGALQAQLLSYGLVPVAYLPAGTASPPPATTQLTNQWAGQVVVTTQDAGANFAITYTKVPKAMCYFLVYSVPRQILTAVGAGAAGATSSAADVQIDALSLSSVSTICASGTLHWATANSSL